MTIACAYCGKGVEKSVGHVNRANKMELKLYCNRACAGLAKRTSKEEKIKLKADYDRKRRKELGEFLKQKQRVYNASPAGRAMQKRNREKFKQNHLEYCRTEEYRKWKHDYDQEHAAKKVYGEFWESHLILKKIITIIEPEKQEVKIQKGTYNKCQKRKRLWNSQQKI